MIKKFFLFLFLLGLFAVLPVINQAMSSDDRNNAATDPNLITQVIALREALLQLNNEVKKLEEAIVGLLAIKEVRNEIQKEASLKEHLQQLVTVMVQDEIDTKNLEEYLKDTDYTQMTYDELQETVAFLKLSIYYQAEIREVLQNVKNLLETLLIKIIPTMPTKRPQPTWDVVKSFCLA